MNLANLTRQEKLDLLDDIWASLAESVDDIEMPASHEIELENREQRIASGQSSFSDWDEARKRIFAAVKK